MARHPGIVVRALSWNLYHGRDFPADPELFTWRSKLLRRSESNATHVQVNRPLLEEFAAVLGSLEWQLALLQEAPPRWLAPLARALAADGAAALTARNFGAPVRARLAARNPDLVGPSEGGSNQLLVRAPWRIVGVSRHTIARRPERRRMLFATLEHASRARLAVANLHASTDPAQAGAEVLAAATEARRLAARLPLIFGGDLNIRPRRDRAPFEELERSFGLRPATGPDAIDHLLSELALADAPHALPDAARELPAGGGRRLRLSDHPAVTAAWRMP